MLNARTITKELEGSTTEDAVYSSALSIVPAFRFDETVARVFPDMIRRSVPGYETTLDMIGVMTDQFVQPGTNCYDLGCSLGASLLAMRRAIGHPGCKVVGIDTSSAMVEHCQKIIDEDDSITPVEIRQEDIRETPIHNASVVTSNFTLQFLPPQDRLALLRRVREGMVDDGIFILSEKVHFDNEANQELQTRLHHRFKRAQGYSDLEIAQKRTAIENVLIPDTIEEHRTRLHMAGFSQVQVWFQCFSFVSLVAIP